MAGRGRLRFAQVDVNLFGDPKIRRLFRILPDERDAYAAAGIWLDILLASWSDEERVSAADVIGPDAYAELQAALAQAGLLDAEGRIPERSWAKWWSSIESDRERWRKNKRSQRMSSDVPEDTRGHDEDTRGPSYSYSDSSSPSLPEMLGVGDRTPGLDLTYYDLTGRVMSSKQLGWARSLEEQYGVTTAIETMKRVYDQGHRADSILPDTSDALKLLANGKARREEEEKAARERQARRDRSERQQRELREARERSEQSAPRPLADIMPDIAQVLGKSKGDEA